MVGISGRGEQKDWFRHTMALAPPAGTTEIVVQLGLDNPYPDGTYCNSHSPLFDNVTVERAGGVVTAVGPSTPSKRRLLRQNRPNPFNPATVIEYRVPTDGEHVRLRLYDTSGRILRTLVDGTSTSGQKSVMWDGIDDRGQPMASGVYFYELSVGDERETRRMVLLK